MVKKLYQNKNWLQQKYVIEKLSTLKIGRLCKVNAETIRTYLKRNNIKTRSKSEAKLEWHKKNPSALKGRNNPRWGKPISEEHRVRIKEFMKTFRHSEETRRKMSENSVWWGRKHTKETRKKISEANKGKTLSEEHKEILRNSLNRRPTNPERIFNEMTPSNVRYVGNRSWWRKLPNGKYKNPDFKVTGRNKVIEVYGDYFHRNDNPQDLIDLYKQIGIDCLIIWEHEIYKQPNQVQMKVKEFILEEAKNERIAYR